ncbi:response regulator [Lederbergia sp. NSJ-179]|uniref:response regulator transcription factor n=1 Tax=Lederbergia sp. NSJ-179 TaxID=2931402 RepID=UPI001FD22A32|nr:response regulator [Lederbergia sp. NSJ-179]MCJ7839770.1 response regulator [Lederbergia sp. NSJ-179]
MYKVLLVDDEINILQGIALLVNWEKYGTKLIAEAYHGKMALDFVEKEVPDIVITDIKMPGMNGIELIGKIHAAYPQVKFIILSGYDEFEFAKTAMAYGVKHYLLKPSNEMKIEQALLEVVEEVDEQNRTQQFISTMDQKIKKMIPGAKEQFLKEYMTNKNYGAQEWERFEKFFAVDIPSSSLRLLIFMIEKENGYEPIYALKNMMLEEMKKDRNILLDTVIDERIVMLVKDEKVENFIETIKRVQKKFIQAFQVSFITAISGPGNQQEIRDLYNEALDCLSERFYLGEGSIITKKEWKSKRSNEENFHYDHEKVILSIRNGDLIGIRHYLEKFFVCLKKDGYNETVVKTHSLDLLMSIIRQASKDHRKLLFKQIIQFLELPTFKQVKEYIVTVAEDVVKLHYTDTKKIQSHVIRQVIEYVDEHLDDEGLSITKIANDIVYLNPDYLGKLFKKEVGEKFSNFLIEQRVKKAIELLEQPKEMKMFEIAEIVGFGSNPRYFSQVFKKQTGFTPTEYKIHYGLINRE